MYNQEQRNRTASPQVAQTTTIHRENGASPSRRLHAMDASEQAFIRITNDDISQANQLSLQCPICGSAVENHVHARDLVPVVCDQCGTLYHKTCWEQSGNKCAVLGCNHNKFHVYGQETGPVLQVNYTDLPTPSINGRGPSGRESRRLKEEQRRQVEQMRRPGFWARFWQWLLDQIRVG